MRALLVTDWLPGTGGAEHYVIGLRNGLRSAGEEVRLLTSTAGTAADRSAEYQAYGTEHMVPKAVLQIANPFAVLALRSALREFRPDVVVVNMFEHQLSPAILGLLRDVPAIQMVTDYKPVCPTGSKLLPSGRCCTDQPGLVCWREGCVSLPHWMRDQPRYALIRAGRGHFDRVLACSRWVQRELALSGVASEHLTLPIPPPGPGFRRAPARHPQFVYCGRLEPLKGMDLLLRAFARLRGTVPAARLRVVGRGSQREVLEKLAAAPGLAGSVEFRGYVAPTEVEHELTDAWALVVPSLWAEPLGLVAIEAIARGVPVIVSGNGGLGEVVRHGTTGLVFPNGDEEALLGHLVSMATGATFVGHVLPQELVADIQDLHSESRHIDRMREIFRQVARPRGHSLVSRTA